jgi:hypothetical protein
MTQKPTTARGGTPASTATDTNRTKALLACGAIAGPLHAVAPPLASMALTVARLLTTLPQRSRIDRGELEPMSST